MDRDKIRDMILPEEGYEEMMKMTVEPYVAERRTEDFCEREKGKRIFYVRCLADDPRGVVIISHGYTETIEKHLENIYYFLRGGYHVFMPEHCGHGRSYRVCGNREDPCPVHVDDYQRYVDDLLFVSRMAAREFHQLPVFLYGHSMGGGIAAATAAQAFSDVGMRRGGKRPLFSGMILSSPMIRPKSASVPWPLACLLAGVICLAGGRERYLMGNHPYDGEEKFADSASGSEARFDYYQKKRRKEPLFQMNAASYGWFWQTVRLNVYLQKKAWKRINCPAIVFQAGYDTYVSGKEQETFVRKLNRRQKGRVRLVRVHGAKHEIFNSETYILERYWKKIFSFLRL